MHARRGLAFDMSPSNASVPDELLQQFHQSAQHLHESKAEWEKWLAASEYRHQERVESAREKLRQAEHEMEAVELRIQNAMSAGTEKASEQRANASQLRA